tara:strand:- start:4172 stop:5434 length:1263 start_codon:yes stop_codon:yes gene_type:complete
MALPTNVGYGTVTGRFMLAYADGSDADVFPDGVPAKGTVYLTPSPIYLRNALAAPAPVTILPSTVECALDADGYILGTDGNPGVRLVATDDADNNPVNWTWSVEFRLTDQDNVPIRTIPKFSFELPQGTSVDLTDVTPVTDANGTFYLVGPVGPPNVLTVGTVDTVVPENDATVVITGTAPEQVINFEIPQGVAATLDAGTTTTSVPGTPASVTNSGTTADAIFDFDIPQGAAATIAVGGTATVVNGTPAAVSNSGTSADAVLDFTIPAGPTGPQGPIGLTGATGIEWRNAWDSSVDYVNNDAVFYLGASWFASGDPVTGEVPESASTHWYPLALQGIQGIQGDAATIAVGTVTTGDAGTSTIITNVGTNGSAVFDFTVPKGDTGSLGALTALAPVLWNPGSSQISFDHDAIAYIDGGTA